MGSEVTFKLIGLCPLYGNYIYNYVHALLWIHVVADDHELLYPLQDGYTPLYLAAKEGHTACVEHLLSTPGIDVNFKSKVSLSYGYSCMACGQSFRKCVNLNEGHNIVW